MGKRIGIIIHSGANLFSNGITQNAWFIYECLTLCGYSCEFLCHERDPQPFSYKGILLRSFAYEVPYHEYLMIMSVTKGLLPQQYTEFHKHNIPVVSFICGNHFMNDMEAFVNSNSTTIHYKQKVADIIWIIPSIYYSATYFETLIGLPVFEIPHLWSPQLLEHRALSLSHVPPESLFFKKTVYKTIDIIVLEPNIGCVKNAVLALTAAEMLHKTKPGLIRRVYLTNIRDNLHIKKFIDTLTVPISIQHGYKEMDQVLTTINDSTSMPIFICNQLFNSLNYLYYECLYYGYPLVHNSLSLDDCGYFYDGHNVSACADAVLKAFKSHTVGLYTYKKKVLAYLERVNPYSTAIQAKWTQAVRSLTE